MRKDPWNPDVEFPWDTIKQVWHRYWDLTKPWLIEKSPPNLVRAREIARCFDPAYFLVMVRNPYAHCASLMRRSGWEATRAASFSVDCLRRQADNAKVLQNVVRLTYEGFANDSKATARAIQAALPGIGSFDCDAAFEIHSSLAADGRAVVAQGIVNHNAHAFETLSPADVEQIGAVLSQHSQVLQYWGYEHCEPRLHK